MAPAKRMIETSAAAAATAAGLLTGLATPALAHHSFALFDQNKSSVVVGTVKEFQWTNPHVWVQLNVAGPNGAVQEWGIEGSTPGILGRRGWTRHSLQPGDKVSVTIHPLKNGDHGGSLVKVTKADGQVLEEAAGVGANSPVASQEK